jgi:hypothetical protein
MGSWRALLTNTVARPTSAEPASRSRSQNEAPPAERDARLRKSHCSVDIIVIALHAVMLPRGCLTATRDRMCLRVVVQFDNGGLFSPALENQVWRLCGEQCEYEGPAEVV